MTTTPDGTTVRPETRALDTLIQTTVERVIQASGQGAPDAMLFLGNWHDAFPALLVRDPVLEPVDKVVWQAIKLEARDTAGATAFPSYRRIGEVVHVADATIARSIAILRTTRWLTLCRRVRDRQGRFKGNVYALHDEPLPLADTVYMDKEYMQFLKQSLEHGHAQVCRIAAAVLGTIEDDIRAGRDIIGVENPISRRVEATRTLKGETSASSRLFSLSFHRLQNLKSAAEQRQLQDLKTDPLQNLKLDPLQNSKSVCSSSYIKTTTTTKPPDQKKSADTPTDNLVYPDRLTGNQREIAVLYVSNIPEKLRQPVLDELHGRLQAEKHGAPRVYDPLRYLHHLCSLTRTEKFISNLGIPVREQRERQARVEQSNQAAQRKAPPAPRHLADDDQPKTALTQRCEEIRRRYVAKSRSDSRTKQTVEENAGDGK